VNTWISDCTSTPRNSWKGYRNAWPPWKASTDAVFLGYGYCQTLKGLPGKVNVPLVMLEYEDCIAAMLPGDEYHREKRSGGITWFYPAGWAKNGPDGLIKLFKLDSMKDQGYEPLFFMKMMFDGFTRVLFIDTGAGDVTGSETRSKELACMPVHEA